MARGTPTCLWSGLAARPALTCWPWHTARSPDDKEQLLEVISLFLNQPYFNQSGPSHLPLTLKVFIPKHSTVTEFLGEGTVQKKGIKPAISILVQREKIKPKVTFGSQFAFTFGKDCCRLSFFFFF